MPDKCCIVGCKTNYIDGPKNSVFYFPQDEELKKKWIRFVNRKKWTPTKHSVICAEHFSDDLIISHKKKSLLEWSSSPVPFIYLTKIALFHTTTSFSVINRCTGTSQKTSYEQKC